MKFMKLGSKPDAFQTEGNSSRYVLSELETDVAVTVGEVKFYLHKFPLLSKSNKLQKLISKVSEGSSDEIELSNFPGGPKAFEICAKFCYGMVVTLNAYNVVAARCGAEYLEMTEDVDRGNLIFKIEVFLNSSVFRSWKDSIIVLQTTKCLLPWSEDLKIVGRCIDSIASKTSMDPSLITWSYTYNRKLSTTDKIVEDEVKFTGKMECVPKDWWVEDICELEIDLYKQVMIAVKSKGRMESSVIGEALKAYAVRWLSDSIDTMISEVHQRRNKTLVETIICLLPSDKASGCSCSFLLKLLKVAILVGVDDPLREDLIENISLKLDEASVNDLLIPARSPQTTVYDVELVESLVKRFVTRRMSCEDVNLIDKNNKKPCGLVLGSGTWLNIGRLVDCYLSEIARDPNLSFSCFVQLAQMIPECGRLTHDGLYAAIDIYLKEHPTLTKIEKKNLCGLMDVKKLTTDASMHAAQNEMLPLRLIVQILYFEQVRAAAAVLHQPKIATSNNENHHHALNSRRNMDEDWEKMETDSEKRCLRRQVSQLKIRKEEDDDLPKNVKKLGQKSSSKNRGNGAQLLPSRSRRIFDKLWVVGKSHGNAENRSSETSGSSQSPTSMIQGEVKSSSSSRHRRHSIS